MKVLVTGGTGFIGSYVVMALLRDWHEVTILARNANKVPAFHTLPNVHVLQVPMTDFEGTSKAVKGMDACVHVALNYNDESAYQMLMNDTAPSVYLAREAAKAGVKHFIYTSSTAANDNVYSQANPPVLTESQANVKVASKHDPQTYYGATKAAIENYLMAISSQAGMRVNIIRPGYTFGNPVIEGAFTQPDTRFKNIVEAAVHGKDIEVIKHDGTQFLWGGDLAKIYVAVLNSAFNKHTYFGLSKEFTSWEFIANEAVRICNSSSKVVIKDMGWKDTPILFDVSDIKKDFGFSFSPFPYIQEHIAYFKSVLIEK